MNVHLLNTNLQALYAKAVEAEQAGHARATVGREWTSNRTTKELIDRDWQTLGSRTDDYKRQNKMVRAYMYEAICSQVREMGMTLDGLSKESQKILKIGDYKVEDGEVTSRRPLTAYRIIAVAKELARLKEDSLTQAQRAVLVPQKNSTHTMAYNTIRETLKQNGDLRDVEAKIIDKLAEVGECLVRSAVTPKTRKEALARLIPAKYAIVRELAARLTRDTAIATLDQLLARLRERGDLTLDEVLAELETVNRAD